MGTTPLWTATLYTRCSMTGYLLQTSLTTLEKLFEHGISHLAVAHVVCARIQRLLDRGHTLMPDFRRFGELFLQGRRQLRAVLHRRLRRHWFLVLLAAYLLGVVNVL